MRFPSNTRTTHWVHRLKLQSLGGAEFAEVRELRIIGRRLLHIDY